MEIEKLLQETFIDFDIEKYSNQLVNNYKKIECFNTLKSKALIIERLERIVEHYEDFKEVSCPEKLTNILDEKIEEYEYQEEKCVEALSLLLKFDCINDEIKERIEKELLKANQIIEVSLYSIGDLPRIPIIERYYMPTIEEIIEELRQEQKESPYPFKVFCEKKRSSIITEFKESFETIISNKFLANMKSNVVTGNTFSRILHAFIEVQCLESLLTGKKITLPPSKPLKWNANKNDLITLFKALKDNGIIQATSNDISRMIRYIYEDKDGNRFTDNYIKDVFKPSKNKESKPVLEVIPELIQVLQENTKK